MKRKDPPGWVVDHTAQLDPTRLASRRPPARRPLAGPGAGRQEWDLDSGGRPTAAIPQPHGKCVSRRRANRREAASHTSGLENVKPIKHDT